MHKRKTSPKPPPVPGSRRALLGRLGAGNGVLTVVGAGMAGLLTAYYAKKAGMQVTVLEASSRAGGLIATEPTAFGPVETAAHSFLMTPEFDALLEDLKVEVSRPRRKARYVVRNGRARRFPLSAAETLEMGFHLLKGRSQGSSTLTNWGDDVLGPAARRYLLEPAMAGIFAGDCSRMSLRGVFPELADALEGRSLARHLLSTFTPVKGGGPKGMFACAKGSQALTDALAKSLGPALKLNTRVESVAPLLKKGSVVIATEAPAAAALLATVPAFPSDVAAELAAIDYVPMVTTTVFARRADFSALPEGVGALAAPGENLRLTGVLFNSSAFEGRSFDPAIVSLTAMMGGAFDRQAILFNEAEIQSIVARDLGRLFGFKGEPLLMRTKAWRRALPHYTRELEGLWPRLGAALPQGLALAGNYTGFVATRAILQGLSKEFLSIGGCDPTVVA